MAQTVQDSLEGNSPRSTILGAPPSPSPHSMPSSSEKRGAPQRSESDPNATKQGTTAEESNSSTADSNNNSNNSRSSNNNNNSNGTPTGTGVVVEGVPSSATSGDGRLYGTDPGVYATSTAAFFPPVATTAANAAAFGAPVNPFAPHRGASPLSPPRTSTSGIPPASPLFPRLPNNTTTDTTTTTNNNTSNTTNGGAEAVNHNNTPGAFGYAVGGAAPSYSNAPGQLHHNNNNATTDGDTGEDTTESWSGRNSQQAGTSQQQPGIPMPYGMSASTSSSRAASGARAYSFETDSMLPPAAIDAAANEQGTPNPAYSPYAGSTASSNAAQCGAPTLFAGGQQQWGYGAAGAIPPPDMYGTTPASPLQPRPTLHMPLIGYGPPHHHHPHHQGHPPPPHHLSHAGHHHHPNLHHPMGAALGMRTMPMGAAAAYGAASAGGAPHHHHQYFPTTSPGPPIQTTASNKGPDGANLFIFHIPNHFTNLDMYQLFEPYGNLLSVRIMVEKDTGRSRGFGFVSYDSPESAALAIKALNGFAIGNKRLKVQHKQIRPKDVHTNDRENGGGGGGGGYGVDAGVVGGAGNNSYGNTGHMMHTLPPSGPSGWYDRKSVPASGQQGPGVEGGSAGGGDDQNTELTSVTSTGGDTALGLSGTPVSAGEHTNGGGGGGGAGGGGGGGGPSSVSPLASLGSLQSALPNVGKGVTTGNNTAD